MLETEILKTNATKNSTQSAKCTPPPPIRGHRGHRLHLEANVRFGNMLLKSLLWTLRCVGCTLWEQDDGSACFCVAVILYYNLDHTVLCTQWSACNFSQGFESIHTWLQFYFQLFLHLILFSLGNKLNLDFRCSSQLVQRPDLQCGVTDVFLMCYLCVLVCLHPHSLIYYCQIKVWWS